MEAGPSPHPAIALGHRAPGSIEAFALGRHADVGFPGIRFRCFGPANTTLAGPSVRTAAASGRTYALDEEQPAIATPPINSEPRINERIRAREVRLVGPDGEQVGIKTLPDALNFARSLDLDLVEVADKANPPVCRVMDYGKYKYEAAQKAKESRRKSTNVVIKEMKYRPKIGGGDFDTKTRKVEKFLAEGHKVKITIMFRGREVAHPELGKRILDKVAEEVINTGRVEVYPKLDGPRNMIMVLAPDKKAQAAHAAEAKKTDQPVSENEVEAPEVEAPEVESPEVESPEVETPEVEAAEAPTSTDAEAGQPVPDEPDATPEAEAAIEADAEA